MRWIYLDNNATTQPAPQVVEAMREALEQVWANPSSVHRFGQMARQRVELARASVASLIGCQPRQVIFTSGGTESNHLALRGVLGHHRLEQQTKQKTVSEGLSTPHGGAALITTAIEHVAIREPAQAVKKAGVAVHYLPVADGGYVNPDDLAQSLEGHASQSRVILVSIQWANNETGAIQPIEQLAQIVSHFRRTLSAASSRRAKQRVLFHVDATQAIGKVPVNVGDVPVDLMTLSAHKFHGPKGVGALYIREGVRLKQDPLGGPQEREIRGGTENTPGIVGMGVAAELAQTFVTDDAEIARLRGLRDRFERAVIEALPQTVINSGSVGAISTHVGADNGLCHQRLWNTSNLGFPRLESEAILLGLSEQGLCASAGAACSSGSLEPSPVLTAMGVSEQVAHGSVRFSLSRWTSDEEMDEAARVVIGVVKRLNKTMPMTV